jgi:hypothetical protein
MIKKTGFSLFLFFITEIIEQLKAAAASLELAQYNNF